MKNKIKLFVIYVLLFLLILFFSTGCVSIQENKQFRKLANEHPFEYFFPSSNFFKEFSTIEEAYDYVNAADIKIWQLMINKRRVKGYKGKLSGTTIGNSPVTVVSWIRAQDRNSNIDLSTNDNIDLSTNDMVTSIRNAASVFYVFVVFYNDKIIAIPNWYLDNNYSGYREGNRQINTYNIVGNNYTVENPVGWNLKKAFQYLSDSPLEADINEDGTVGAKLILIPYRDALQDGQENIGLNLRQRLVWGGGENALRFNVVIEKEEDEIYINYLNEFTTSHYLNVSLQSGNYRFRIIPHDILDRPTEISASGWVSIEIP